MTLEKQSKDKTFSRYEVFIIAIIAIIQFTVILDFMVLSPLGVILMEELKMNTSQFGIVVSAYALSAGASGLLTAGFADKFDRKKLLLFFYSGFIIGTLLCAIARDYHFLLIARIVTGLFGGVISSISMAIITDLFKLEVRGRVMGFVQMSFAASQVLGIPIGLMLANNFGWYSSFWMIALFGLIPGVVILLYMKPVTAHLQIKSDSSPLAHLGKTISQSNYQLAFLSTTLLATGGFMLMPFATTFSTNNLGILKSDLPLLYGITGIFSIVFGPLIGKLSDKIGKYKVFCIGSIVSMVMIGIYNNLGITPLWLVIIMNVIVFVGVSSRIISSSALVTSIPKPQDRGAFMSINSSVQQISGGIASAIAGLIVVQTTTGTLNHYDTLGYVVIVAIAITMVMMYFINQLVKRQTSKKESGNIEKVLTEA